MIVAVLVLLGGFALIILSGPTSISTAASLSMVLVSLPFFLAGILVLAIVLALLFGLGWALREIPSVTRVAQDYSQRVAQIVQRATQQVTNMVIPALTGFSMVRHILGGNEANSKESHSDTHPSP